MDDYWKDVGVPENPNFKCPACGSREELHYHKWESSDGAYEDINYKCGKCGKEWWVESADY